MQNWLDATRLMDGVELERLLREGWNTLGSLRFMERILSPYLLEVGEMWSRGELSVGQEHYASNRVTQFLMSHWLELAKLSNGPIALCATLPAEPHVIGLHMAATTLALRGWSIRFLGADTPVEDIAQAAVAGVKVVVVGVSASAYGDNVVRHLRELRNTLPVDVPIWIGGAPFRVPTELVAEQFDDLQALWLVSGSNG